MRDDVMAITEWASNAELIRDVARVGYLQACVPTYDCTYGLGVFWKLWKPAPGYFFASDINPDKSPIGYPIDFTKMPWKSGLFYRTVFDPPYKMNGTATGNEDRYGVEDYEPPREREHKILVGISECARVTAAGGYVFVKCQNQVAGSIMHWQAREFANYAEDHCDLRQDDEFHMIQWREQPEDAPAQKHARHNYSTLLVFKKVRSAKKKSPPVSVAHEEKSDAITGEVEEDGSTG